MDAASALTYSLIALFLLPTTASGAASPGRSGYSMLVWDTRYLLYLGAMLLSSVVYLQFMTTLPLQLTAVGQSAGFYSVVLTASSVLVIAAELKITTYVRHRPPALAGPG